MKVLHCPTEIAGNMARICRHLKDHYYDSVSMNRLDTGALGYKCDININPQGYNHDYWFKWAVEQDFDIIHYHFPIAGTLLPGFADMAKFREMGKKIVVSYWGSDQRNHEWGIYNRAKFLGYDPPKPFFLNPSLATAQNAVMQYADAVFANMCVPMFLPYLGLIDTDDWLLEEKDRYLRNPVIQREPDKVYFVHSASSEWKKGTHLITEGFKRVQAAGIPAELILVTDTPPEEAKKVYACADYGVEGITVGGHGLFGLELMAWKIPVFCYKTRLGDAIRFDPPTIHIDAGSFADIIREYTEIKLNKSKLYSDMSQESSEYVEAECDIYPWVQDIMDIYDSLLVGAKIKMFNNFPRWIKEVTNIHECLKKEKNPKRSEFYRYLHQNDLIDALNLGAVIDKLWDKRLYVGADE